MILDRRAAALLRADFVLTQLRHKDDYVSINDWKLVRVIPAVVLAVILAVGLAGTTARADGSGDPAVASSDNGKYEIGRAHV